MGMLKKREVKFCPLCASPVTAEKDSPYSVCNGCGFGFCVSMKPVLSVATVDGKTYLSECGKGKGKNGGKIAYETVEAAFARCLTLEDIPHRERHRMEFYKCRWCEKIHMGHGGKHKKNVTTSYTFERAKALYEQSLANAEVMLA